MLWGGKVMEAPARSAALLLLSAPSWHVVACWLSRLMKLTLDAGPEVAIAWPQCRPASWHRAAEEAHLDN